MTVRLPWTRTRRLTWEWTARGEDDFFEVFAEADEVVDGVAVADVLDVLVDDGALVEVRGDVVAGSADDFDAAFVGLVVGFCAGEGGEEGVVDVDHLVLVEGTELRADDLHVAGEDDGIDPVFAEESDLALFLLAFVFRVDGEDVEGDAEALGRGAQAVVVGDDEGDFDLEFAGGVAGEEIVEAV